MSNTTITLFATKSPREKSGSISGNRFDYQLSWALCHMLNMHEIGEPYIMLLDYHDDLVVLTGNDSTRKANFYQIKTKTTGKWTLKSLLAKQTSEELENSEKVSAQPDNKPKLSILGKIFHHTLIFGEHVAGLHFVSNAYFSFKEGNKYKEYEAVKIDEIEQHSLNEIRVSIQQEHNLNYTPYGNLGISLSTDSLSLRDHSTHALGRFSEFVYANLALSKCPLNETFNALVYELRRRSNCEDTITSEDALCRKKGFSGDDFQQILDQIAHRFKSTSWASHESALKSEGYNYFQLRKLKNTWEKVGIQLLDPTNVPYRKAYSIIKEFISKEIDSTNHTTLTSYLNYVYDSTKSHFMDYQDIIDQDLVSAISLICIDEN